MNCSQYMKTTTIALFVGYAGLAQAAPPFAFDSGSNGADGALIESCNIATTITVDVGASGVMHYTNIDIGENCTVKFTPTGNGTSHKSNPVRLLVSGDVVINGVFDLDGSKQVKGKQDYSAPGGIGGPGGFNGGNTGFLDLPAGTGYGPGGGNGFDNVFGTVWLGLGFAGLLSPTEADPRLQALIGGSGGGGASTTSLYSFSSSGSGGGGAILIAATGKISVNGKITAISGRVESGASYKGGGGGGGMIHLISNTIDASGELHAGKIILESSDKNITLTKRTGTRYEIALQRQTLNLTTAPTLSIASIGEVDSIDEDVITLDAAGETTVSIWATGLSESTEITVTVTGNTQQKSSATTALNSLGEGSVNIDIPPGVSMITAHVSLSLTQVAVLTLPSFNGENIAIAKLEVMLGEKAELVFYTESGKVVPKGYVKKPWKQVQFNS